jgi:hypothetical protein
VLVFDNFPGRVADQMQIPFADRFEADVVLESETSPLGAALDALQVEMLVLLSNADKS